MTTDRTGFGRVLRTGLLGRARALLRGLGPMGEYPSRGDWPCDLDVEEAIHAWHDGAGAGLPLHEYLGWTWEEYKAWVCDR